MTKLLEVYKCEVCGNVVQVIHEGDGMYGSILVSGPNLAHWVKGKDLQFDIVDDAAFASSAYMAHWNTAFPSEKGQRIPYAQKIVEQFTPWVKAIASHLPEPAARPK